MSSYDGIPTWPRGWRLVIYILALVVTVVIIVPLFIMGAGYVLGYDKCPRADSIICSQTGQIFLVLVLLGIGLPLARAWSKFLVSCLTSTSDARGSGAEVANVEPLLSTPLSVDLPGFQRLATGTIEQNGSTGHSIRLEGIELTSWSALARLKGQLKGEERALIVFQRTPLRSFNLALAYWDWGSSTVRGVAGATHGASMLIAAASFLIFALLRPPFAALWMSLSGLYAASSCLYLALMVRAKAALRDSVYGPGQSHDSG